MVKFCLMNWRICLQSNLCEMGNIRLFLFLSSILMSIFDSEKKMILLKKNLEACFALGIETPWGGDLQWKSPPSRG